jgi:hypothetical protein
MAVIDDFIEYVEAGRLRESLKQSAQDIGAKRLRGAAIKVLGWLKDQNRREREAPLSLNMNYPWCNELAMLVRPGGVLSPWFAISDNEFDFHSGVGEDERKDIRAAVDRGFNPPLRTLQ